MNEDMLADGVAATAYLNSKTLMEEQPVSEDDLTLAQYVKMFKVEGDGCTSVEFSFTSATAAKSYSFTVEPAEDGTLSTSDVTAIATALSVYAGADQGWTITLYGEDEADVVEYASVSSESSTETIITLDLTDSSLTSAEVYDESGAKLTASDDGTYSVVAGTKVTVWNYSFSKAITVESEAVTTTFVDNDHAEATFEVTDTDDDDTCTVTADSGTVTVTPGDVTAKVGITKIEDEDTVLPGTVITLTVSDADENTKIYYAEDEAEEATALETTVATDNSTATATYTVPAGIEAVAFTTDSVSPDKTVSVASGDSQTAITVYLNKIAETAVLATASDTTAVEGSTTVAAGDILFITYNALAPVTVETTDDSNAEEVQLWKVAGDADSGYTVTYKYVVTGEEKNGETANTSAKNIAFTGADTTDTYHVVTAEAGDKNVTFTETLSDGKTVQKLIKQDNGATVTFEATVTEGYELAEDVSFANSDGTTATGPSDEVAYDEDTGVYTVTVTTASAYSAGDFTVTATTQAKGTTALATAADELESLSAGDVTVNVTEDTIPTSDAETAKLIAAALNAKLKALLGRSYDENVVVTVTAAQVKADINLVNSALTTGEDKLAAGKSTGNVANFKCTLSYTGTTAEDEEVTFSTAGTIVIGCLYATRDEIVAAITTIAQDENNAWDNDTDTSAAQEALADLVGVEVVTFTNNSGASFTLTCNLLYGSLTESVSYSFTVPAAAG